ncbi:MAG: TIGR02147 family protein [Chitinivibrionales bacterium]|nr:TIGR02147 family protein [Chitinivibrionales bacterium]
MYMESVFEFIDYRQFLNHYYYVKKAETRYFSFRYFANKAGINSSSFLKHVIDGRRNLTPVACVQFCAALGLDGKQATYFRHLVMFNQARTAAAILNVSRPQARQYKRKAMP